MTLMYVLEYRFKINYVNNQESRIRARRYGGAMLSGIFIHPVIDV